MAAACIIIDKAGDPEFVQFQYVTDLFDTNIGSVCNVMCFPWFPQIRSPRCGPSGRSKLYVLKIVCIYIYMARASPVAQLVKNPNARQETSFQFLGREDPLEMG